MPILSGIRISKLIRFPESLTSIRRGDFPWFEFWCLLLLYVICVFSGNSLQSLKVHKWVANQKYRYVNRNEIKSIISTYLCIVIKHLFDFVTEPILTYLFSHFLVQNFHSNRVLHGNNVMNFQLVCLSTYMRVKSSWKWIETTFVGSTQHVNINARWKRRNMKMYPT